MQSLRWVTLCALLFCVWEVKSFAPTTNTNTFVPLTSMYWLDTEIAVFIGRNTSLDRSNRLYRTTDGGATWTDITNALSTANDDPPFQVIYVNPINKAMAYIPGSGDYNWITSDKGQTWTAVVSALVHVALEWHPANPKWVLSAAPETVNSYSLYLSQDGAASWVKVADNIQQFTWGDAGTGDVPSARIYMILKEDVDGEVVPYNFYCTDDFGSSKSLIEARAYQFVFLTKQVFIVVYLPTASDVAVKVSADMGMAVKTFNEAVFPFGDELPNNGYSIIDDTTGAVYLGINHGDFFESHWGNVYVSDSTGSRYVLSLQHTGLLNIPVGGGSVAVIYDFDIINGVEGVYMANVLSNWQASGGSGEVDQLQTYLTCNNGNTWHLLAPPHFDSHGNPIKCSGCNLHLSGYINFVSSSYGPFYSADSAIGLIIATGSVGPYLTTELSEVNTYLSRDAGITWIELRKGSSIYEIGDHGGIIVLAPYGQPTDTIYFTLDFGTTSLQSFKFSDTPVDVVNIITEPTWKSRKFILITQDDMYISLDFTTAFPRVCGDSDYELWSPTRMQDSQTCLMGRIVTYKRRNATALCYNDLNLDAIVSSTNCLCTEEDYECDLGYERDGDNACVLSPSANPPSYPPKYCPENGVYYKTKGYRLEAGNSCGGGVDHRPSGPYECPSDLSTLSHNKGWIAAVVIIPLAIILVIGGFLALRSEKIREKVPFIKKLSTWKVGYFGVQNPELGPDMPEEDQEQGHTFPVEYEHDEHDTYTDLQIDKKEAPKPTTNQPANLMEEEDDFNPRA